MKGGRLDPQLAACLCAGALGLVFAAPATEARAWACLSPSECPVYCGTVEYAVGIVSTELEAFGSGTTVAQVQQGVDDWTLVSCTSATSSYIGRTTAPPVNGDFQTTYGWHEDGWPYDSNVVGLTTIDLAPAGCIIEADVELNGVDFAWTTGPGVGGTVNAYTVLLHESGHVFGLGHSTDRDAIMYAVAPSGIGTLALDDEQGICGLYPGGGTDCTTTGCPLGMQCVMGACEPGGPVPECTVDSQCATDQVCAPDGTCQPANTGGLALGAVCDANDACNSGLCAMLPTGSFCSQTCDGLDTRSCPADFYCDGATVDVCTVGLCVAGTGGSGALGSVCEEDTDCASLSCARDACSVPCRPEVASECPDGYSCRSLGLPGCGYCRALQDLGGDCQTDADCLDMLCVAVDPAAEGVCTAECVDDADCPAPLLCTDVDPLRVCLPPPSQAGGCGCAVAGAAGPPLSSALGLLVPGLLLAAGRRRRRASDRTRRSGRGARS